jgi:hypothetical protein
MVEEIIADYCVIWYGGPFTTKSGLSPVFYLAENIP